MAAAARQPLLVKLLRAPWLSVIHLTCSLCQSGERGVQHGFAVYHYKGLRKEKPVLRVRAHTHTHIYIYIYKIVKGLNKRD